MSVVLCHTKTRTCQSLLQHIKSEVSHHTYSVGLLVIRALLLPSICVWVSSSQRDRGQEDICFMSAGSVALGSEVISLPLSACGQNMDLSFLKEALRTSVPTAQGGAMERGEEGLEGDGRKRMGWDCRKWQCVLSDKPLASIPTPWGRTGGYKTPASVLSPNTVPDDPTTATCVNTTCLL